MPGGVVIRHEKMAISVKSQRWSRPRKDFVRRIRNDCNTICGDIYGSAILLIIRMKIQSELAQ